MTPQELELREALTRLLPWQLEALLDEQLTHEQRVNVPTAPAPPAERVQAVVVLAGQDTLACLPASRPHLDASAPRPSPACVFS